ncbi:hypothetical protein [Streptomyces sp. DB-54]
MDTLTAAAGRHAPEADFREVDPDCRQRLEDCCRRRKELSEIVLIPLLVLGFALFCVVRQLVLYPCRLDELRYAFHPKYSDERAALDAHRRHRRTVDGEHRKRVDTAERQTAEVTANGQARVRKLRREQDELLQPARGTLLAPELGQLRLYEHALLFKEQVGAGEEASAGDFEEMRLAGLDVDVESGPEEIFINVIRHDGRKYTAAYQRAEYQESKVRAFYNLIYNRVLSENNLDRSRRSRAAEIDAEVARIKADTAAKEEEARQKIAKLVEAQQTDARRTQAQEAWDAACDAWQNLTGRRPQW